MSPRCPEGPRCWVRAPGEQRGLQGLQGHTWGFRGPPRSEAGLGGRGAESFPRAAARAGQSCPDAGLGLPGPAQLPYPLCGWGPAPCSCLENEWLRVQALSQRLTPSPRRLFSMPKVPVVTRCLFITCRESEEPGFGTERRGTAQAPSQQAAPGPGAALLRSGNRTALLTHRGLPSLVTCERSAGSSSS